MSDTPAADERARADAAQRSEFGRPLPIDGANDGRRYCDDAVRARSARSRREERQR